MSQKDDNTLSVKVFEAYSRDIGRGTARIDCSSMDSLGALHGDVIEIIGKRRTIARYLPLYTSDDGKGIIRIDGLIRHNGGLNIGDTVVIRKIKPVNAEIVVVAPLEAIPPLDERYIAGALEHAPLIKGDHVMIPYFGGRLTFQVIDVVPEADALIVTQKTLFQVEEVLDRQEKILADKIYSLVEKHHKQLTNLLEEQTLNEEKVIEIYDKIKKLNEIIEYLS